MPELYYLHFLVEYMPLYSSTWEKKSASLLMN